MDIYSNPQLYDAIHYNYKWDIKLIQNYAKKINGSVLELASGTGRLAYPIIELGLDYTGIELSNSFLQEANKKFNNKTNFVFGDMCDFDLKSTFDFIFIGFNSFLHNLTIIDAKNCLNCVLKHLHPKGQFLLSIFIPDPEFLYRDKNKLYPATDFFQFENSKCRILEKNQYESE
ncbi:MAG TPA: class I SAM-dependent methyltransferase, partial [Flavobacteriales bacterium]|nr:class I SAM-dependent methyltransferase [Flavobacteriales bacterium]